MALANVNQGSVYSREWVPIQTSPPCASAYDSRMDSKRYRVFWAVYALGLLSVITLTGAATQGTVVGEVAGTVGMIFTGIAGLGATYVGGESYRASSGTGDSE